MPSRLHVKPAMAKPMKRHIFKLLFKLIARTKILGNSRDTTWTEPFFALQSRPYDRNNFRIWVCDNAVANE
jgi:hypothetical protein